MRAVALPALLALAACASAPPPAPRTAPPAPAPGRARADPCAALEKPLLTLRQLAAVVAWGRSMSVRPLRPELFVAERDADAARARSVGAAVGVPRRGRRRPRQARRRHERAARQDRLGRACPARGEARRRGGGGAHVAARGDGAGRARGGAGRRALRQGRERGGAPASVGVEAGRARGRRRLQELPRGGAPPRPEPPGDGARPLRGGARRVRARGGRRRPRARRIRSPGGPGPTRCPWETPK